VALMFAGIAGAANDVAPPQVRAAPSPDVEAIRKLLAQGNEAAVLEHAQALLASADVASLPIETQAELLVLQARVYDRREERPDAQIASADRALELLGAGRADSPLALQARQLRGAAYARMRQADAALADLRPVERATREREGAESAAYTSALMDLALAQRVAADYGAALTSLETALAIRRRQVPSDPIAVTQTLIRLGQTQRISGNLEGAEANYREALKLDESAPDPNGRNRALVLYALGNLYRNREDPERAISYYAQAVPAYERAFGADSVTLSHVLNNYGNAESLRPGREEAAVALFERALAIAKRNQSRDPGHYSPIGNIAMVRVWQQRYVEAEAGFRAALEIVANAPAGSEISPLFAQHGLAAALWGQGRYAEAFAAAQSAEATRQAAVREVAAGLSDQQALAFQEQDYATLDHALGIALDSRDPALLERAWSLAIDARGQVTAIHAERLTRARASADPALTPVWQEWLAASAALDRARIDARASQDAARIRLDGVERRLALAMPQARGLASRSIGIAELRAVLPADTALVWLHDLQHRRPQDFANAAVALDDPDLYAFVVPPGEEARVQAIRLGGFAAIAKDVAAWQALLSTPSSSTDLVRERGARVAASVWAPIARAAHAQRVFVIAEGPLLRLPWPALPDGDGYLAEKGPSFHVLNHERELLEPTSTRTSSYGLLAIADPRGDVRTSKDVSRDCNAQANALPALPGARREVSRLQTLLLESDRSVPMLALLGSDATEARFRSEAPHASVLHLATHGIATGDACSSAGTRGVSLAVEPAAKPDAGGATALVLAAPSSASDSANDGLLGSLEIAALDLSDVQWAVLAACTTAAGTTHEFEGLYGLARAFRLAGARSVILSLWQVDDDATAQWSEALYQARLHDRADTPTAQQRAQRAVLAARRAAGKSDHPWYWAGFIAVGDWR
jgi:CHAT domain-containing protein